MPNQSAADNIFRDPLDFFTDREEMLTLFEQLLHSIRPGHLRVLAVKGDSGTGKTFLISYLTERICPKLNWQAGQISFSQSTLDFRSILTALEYAVKNCVPDQSLKLYREKRDEYNRRFDEYRTVITVNQSVTASNQSSLTNINQNTQINVQLRERELHLRSELTHALIELAEECRQPLCLFIDSYEHLIKGDPELDSWLWERVLLELTRVSPQPVLIVTCGWERSHNSVIKPFSHPAELSDFDISQVRSYLEKQGIIPNANELFSEEQKELVSVFFDLTKGHPFVLGLAVTYFKQLDEHERTAQKLRANRPLLSIEVKIEFLKERLLERLPKPHNILLEWAPVLRSFDLPTLQVLLDALSEIIGIDPIKLTYQDYNDFLNYPFIKKVVESGSETVRVQRSIHELLRQVSLDVLSQDHPQIEDQLHRKMATYYWRNVETEREREVGHSGSRPVKNDVKGTVKDEYSKWLSWVPVKEFEALLEWLYHSLQVRELQSRAFEAWKGLTGPAVNGWRRREAESLLKLVQQLEDEREPYLSKTRESYSIYLVWYAIFLEQEARWEEALVALGQAVEIFEKVGNRVEAAIALNNTGVNYFFQRKLELALSFFEQSLALREQINDPVEIALTLNSIGLTYYFQGQFRQALDYFKRALALEEQVNNFTPIAAALSSIGRMYQDQGELEQALSCYERALVLGERANNPTIVAPALTSIAVVYDQQGKLEQALSYYERALDLNEQLGDPAPLVLILDKVGFIYHSYGNLKQSLSCYERALTYQRQVGDPARLAHLLKNIGDIYSEEGYFGRALNYYEQALVFKEQVENPDGLAVLLNDIGVIHYGQGRLDLALSYFERALTLHQQEGDADHIATALNNIGGIYQKQGKLEEALSYSEQALVYDEQTGNQENIAASLKTIASVYQLMGDLEQALSYRKRALALYEQIGNVAAVATTLNAISDIYQHQRKLEEALSYRKRALTLFEQLGDFTNIAYALNNIGFTYEQQGDLNDALSYCERALALFGQAGNLANIALSLYNIGYIHHQQQKWEQAIAYYAKALSIHEGLGQGFEANVANDLEALALCYFELGDFEKGMPYYLQAKHMGKFTDES